MCYNIYACVCANNVQNAARMSKKIFKVFKKVFKSSKMQARMQTEVKKANIDISTIFVKFLSLFPPELDSSFLACVFFSVPFSYALMYWVPSLLLNESTIICGFTSFLFFLFKNVYVFSIYHTIKKKVYQGFFSLRKKSLHL